MLKKLVFVSVNRDLKYKRCNHIIYLSPKDARASRLTLTDVN
jgi:hypothetical protein